METQNWFFTLFFAGWGLLLKPFAENKPFPDNNLVIEVNNILMVMTSITIVICI